MGLDQKLGRNSLLEGGEALEQFAQGSCGCPAPGSVQGQAGVAPQDGPLRKPGLVKVVSAHDGG